MKHQGIKVRKYFKEYRLSNVLAMMRNNTKPPLICHDSAKGKLVVITGATSGIGYASAKKYASQGANLLCINRDQIRSEALKREIEQEYQVQCDYFVADLSSIQETKQATRHLLHLKQSIDVLIHNAGIYLTKRQITSDGIEKVFMVNYLSSFIMNYELREKLKAQRKGRVILVNSEGYRFAAWGLSFDDLKWSKRRYGGLKSYGTAKLAQLLSMHCFDSYFEGSAVTINAMHPGAVSTSAGKDNGPLYQWYKKNILDKSLKPVSIAAEALYYLGIAKEVETISGKFFNLTSLEELAPPALDRDNANTLWDISLRMGKLEP